MSLVANQMKKTIYNLGLITAGSFILSLAIVVFFAPNQIVTGGPPGVGIILFHLLDIPVGLTVLVLNIGLMFIGGKLLGPGYLGRTVYAFVANAAFIEGLAHLMPDPAVTEEFLLNSLYGGILVGVGLGLIFKGEAASGGWTLVARVVASRLKIGVGRVIQFLDLSVIAVSAIAFNSIEAALWAGIGVYVSGVVIDRVLTGSTESKVLHVSTSEAATLTDLLPERVRDSGSFVHCNTVRDIDGNDLMQLVVETREVAHINVIIREVDPNAYVVVIDAVEFCTGRSAKASG